MLGRSLINVGPAEQDAERASKGSLAAARVRAGMTRAVPAHGLPRLARPPADHRRTDRSEQPGQPRRRPVHDVVDAGRGPAEPGESRRPVPDHGVQRVHRAVAGQPGQSGDHAPDQRRDDRVAGVLRDRLDHGPGELLLIQVARIPPAQARESGPGGSQVGCRQSRGSAFSLNGQRTRAGHGPSHGGRRSEPEPGPPPGQPLCHRRRCRGSQNAPGRVPGPAQPAVSINSVLDGLRGPPEQRDRMPAPRVAEQRVGGGAGQEAGRQRPAAPGP